ncbi:MAG: hypothetical protein GWP05_06055 [Anaerolineaceae bacterium]|nr:hypothetical protein [Anaerolineaceae bacterium]
MLEFDCPHCDRQVELDESRRGRPARCPHCQGMFRAPLFDGEQPTPAIPATPAGQPGRSDALLIGAAAFAALGLLLVLPVLIIYRLGDGQLPVPWGLLLATLPLPLAPIGASWYAAGKTDRQLLVWGSRIIGYLWLAAQMYLVFTPMLNR